MDDENIDWQERYSELENEFNEFQDESKMLEEEMEKELTETKEEFKKLNNKYLRLTNDHEESQNRLSKQVKELQDKVSRLEKNNHDLTNKDLFSQSAIRKLEQSVDDLDRAKRQALATICTLENQLADELERNALLEADMDQQKELEVECQRLREQARDLSDDLARQREKQEQIQRERQKHRSGNSMISGGETISQSETNLNSPTSAHNTKTSPSFQPPLGGLSQSMHTIDQSTSHQGQLASPILQQLETSISPSTVCRSSGLHQGSAVDQCEKDSILTSQTSHLPETISSSENVLQGNSQTSVHEKRNLPSDSQTVRNGILSKTLLAEKQSSQDFSTLSGENLLRRKNDISQCSNNSLRKSNSNKENVCNNEMDTSSKINTNQKLPLQNNNNSKRHHQKLAARHSISAVSLVGDLLSKIGSLEAKISSCKQYIRDSPWKSSSNSSSSNNRSNKYLNNKQSDQSTNIFSNHFAVGSSSPHSNKSQKNKQSTQSVRERSELSDRENTPVRKSNKLSSSSAAIGKHTQL